MGLATKPGPTSWQRRRFVLVSWWWRRDLEARCSSEPLLEATTAYALPSVTHISPSSSGACRSSPRAWSPRRWAYRCYATSARHFFMRGLLPLLGGIGTAAAFIESAKDMIDPDYGFTSFGPISGVFVIGVGMLALGVPLMIACAVRLRAFFRGETLNEDTPILVPETSELPAALSE